MTKRYTYNGAEGTGFITLQEQRDTTSPCDSYFYFLHLIYQGIYFHPAQRDRGVVVESRGEFHEKNICQSTLPETPA